MRDAGVTLPEGLQDLIFGRSFNKPLQMRLPRDLKNLEFHGCLGKKTGGWGVLEFRVIGAWVKNRHPN